MLKMEAIIFVIGLVAGGILTSACIALTRRFLPSKVGGLVVGLLATGVLTYLSLRAGFEIALNFVRTQIEPQWEAQGITDYGPSAFVLILSLAGPLVYGVLISGLIASLVITIRRK